MGAVSNLHIHAYSSVMVFLMKVMMINLFQVNADYFNETWWSLLLFFYFCLYYTFYTELQVQIHVAKLLELCSICVRSTAESAAVMNRLSERECFYDFTPAVLTAGKSLQYEFTMCADDYLRIYEQKLLMCNRDSLWANLLPNRFMVFLSYYIQSCSDVTNSCESRARGSLLFSDRMIGNLSSSSDSVSTPKWLTDSFYETFQATSLL